MVTTKIENSSIQLAAAVAVRNIWGTLIYNVKAYGAKGDGVADDTAKIQATVDAAKLVNGIVHFPPGTYKVTSTITISGNGFITIRGSGGKTRQSKLLANVPSGPIIDVTATYSAVIDELYISNVGTQGRCISLAGGEAHAVTNCALENSPGNTDDMIHFNGSNTLIAYNAFNNNESFAYAITCKSITGKVNINSSIIQNYIGNSGKGIVIAADSGTRPEGLKIILNTFLNAGSEQITVNAILHGDISHNMLDQGGLYSIFLNSTGLGINGLYIDNNYISPAQLILEGVAIHAPLVATGVTNVTISDNMFAYTGFGIVAKANSSNWVVKGNEFMNVNHDAIWFDGSSNIIITSNPLIGATDNALHLADGASGGPFNVAHNYIPSPVTLTKTNADKFNIKDNIGFVTNKWTKSAFPVNAAGTQYVYISHGLSAIPNPDKCAVNVNQNGTGAEFGGSWVISVDASNALVGIRVATAGAGNANAVFYAET